MELPTEILLHIFSEVFPSPRNAYADRKPVLTTRQHLNARNDLQTCLLVCKRWNYAATYTLWSELEFFSCHSFIQFLCSISHCSSFLKIIRLATTDELDAVWLQEKTHKSKKFQSSRPYGRNLVRRLAFTPCVTDTQRYPADCPVPKYIQDGHIHVMSENLFYLTSISLEDCVNLTDNSVIHLIVNNHHLVSVDLTNCRKITNVTVQAIAKLCTRLQYLSLRGCGQVTDQGIWDLRSLNLKKVDLSWCRRVSDSGVRHLVTGSEDLHPACKKRASDILGRLDNVHQNESRTSASYEKPQSQLVELRMTGCHRVIGDGLINLVKDLFLPLKNGQTATPLSTFEFSMPYGESAYFDSASTIFELLPRTLLHLYIYDAYGIPEESLTILADCCSQLQSLTLHSCRSMRDDKLAYILSSMTRLKQLCLPSCKFLTSQAIKHIVNSQCSFTLTELDLSDIFHFDDEAVKLLAADAEAFSLEKAANSANSQRPLKLGLLDTLSLRNLSQVTIKSVLLLVRVLPNLHVLDVSGCGEGIADHLPGEESLSINRLADDNHVGDMYNVGGFCRISGERLEELKKW